MIIGFLGNDPEVRYMPSGDAVANFSVATTNRWKDKQSGEQKEHTEWHRCVAFGKDADTINEYLKKGSQVYVEGELRTNKYDDKEGITRYSTEIRVRRFSFLDRKGDSTGAPAGRSKPDAPAKPDPKGDPDDPGASEEDFDDDIPF
jgi:single-strand DNA-binding protein